MSGPLHIMKYFIIKLSILRYEMLDTTVANTIFLQQNVNL